MKRLAALAAFAALALPARALADADVALTTIGYDPAVVTIRAGESIHWTNTTVLPHSVTGATGLFDSGEIPPGGGYSMTFSVPGSHTYGSSEAIGFSGTIRVVATGLPGAATDLALGRIPDLPFAREDAANIAAHPEWGVEASTRRILLGVGPNTAVGEVNEALAEVDAEVVGGLPELKVILVEVDEDPTWAQGQVEVQGLGRFTGVTAALEALRATGVFEYAALSSAVEPAALPRRAEPAVEAALPGWAWNTTGGPNWGLEDARFPYAWNLRESIAAKSPETVTGIVDAGFFRHDDLAGALDPLEVVCAPGKACLTMPNDGNDDKRTHGTLVAGVIGALWDNPATEEPPVATRSKGVSGGNPFAQMIGVSWASTPLFDQELQAFATFLRARPEGMRVINFSATLGPPKAAALAEEFPDPTCGPGPADDDLRLIIGGTRFYCYPATQDSWRRQVASVGHAARDVAREAAAAGVMIVAATGNNNGGTEGYCTPWGDPGCADRAVLAEHVSEFAWASRHWTGSDPNPIFLAEAIGKNGELASFSNRGGDIAAPGVDIGSTGNTPPYKTESGTSLAAPHVTAAIGYLLADDPELGIDEIRDRLLGWGRQPTLKTRANLFDWSVRDRIGYDDDVNGRVDYDLPRGSNPPESYPVDLQACGSAVNGKPALAYRWTLNGETIEQTGCTLRYEFPNEGNYDVKLELLGDDGASASETRTVTADDVLVAVLGDGFAAGEGAPDTSGATVFDKPDWQSPSCHRSAKSGGAQSARWLELADVRGSVSLVQLGCVGARIRGDRDAAGNYVPGPNGNGGLLSPFSGPSGPEQPAQLLELPVATGSRTPDAVVLSAGAEDLRLADILAACLQQGPTCDTGTGAAILNQRLPQLAGRFDELAAAIGALAIPASHVFVTEYPDFTRDDDEAAYLNCVGIEDAEAEWLSNTVRVELNAAIESAATRHGWTLVPLGNAFAHHGVCASQAGFPTTTNLDGIAPGSPQLLGLYHPTATGYSAIAMKIVDAVRDKLALPPIDARQPVVDSSPRLDLYPALLSGDDAAKRLTDVNDVSRDGNRRIVYGPTSETPDTTFSYDGSKTQRDGDVELRDFRRFRDAWLQECLDRPADSACPPAERIHLDGAADHPKKDGNLDACVYRGADIGSCVAHEGDFSRFDFNGDGRVSVEAKARVPLHDDGTVAATPLEGTKMTDLDLFRSQWAPDAGGAEGWNADDLEQLLHSADLEVHADSLFDSTARKASVQVRTVGGSDVGPPRTLRRGDGFIVVTVPTAGANDRFEVVAKTTVAGQVKRFASEQFTLRNGEDRRVDVCAGATLQSKEPRLPADGTSSTDLTLTVSACGGDASGLDVNWSLDPATGGAVLEPGEDPTDAAGKATARLVAGTERETYTVRATVNVGPGRTEEAELQVEIIPKVTIRYLWRQTIEEWNEQGTTRWPDPTPLQPDCFLANLNYCIEEFSIGLAPATSPELQRAGTLTGGGKSVELTEAVLDGGTESYSSWKLTKPDGEAIETGSELNRWSVTDPDAYTGHKLEHVEISDEVDGVHLEGMQEVGSLPYHYSILVTESTGQRDPEELHATRNEFLLIPQGEAPPLNFGAHPDSEIVFNRMDDGFQQYQSCGLYSNEFLLEPGYLLKEDSEFLPGASSLKRKPSYVAGDRPMPVGDGAVRVRYAFAATIAYEGDVPAEPELPSCDENHAPEAEFRWTPDEVDEGRVVRFFDQTKDVDQNVETWEWETSDGQTATGPRPHFLFKDDGLVKVTLTVTDSLGETDTVEHELTVGNLAPEASIDDAAAQVGAPAEVVFRVLDPGEADKRQLHVRITSTNPAWPTVDRTMEADVSGVTYTGLPAGDYPLTLTVLDKDGEVAEDTATLSVTAVAPPPPPDEVTDGIFPTCDPETALDPEEQAFVALVNEYRADNGLGPVSVSATLTRAAERHAHDMAVLDFMEHEGSDGSSPADRAFDAGYPNEPGISVSENLSEGRTTFDVLWNWRSSVTGHNENMVNPAWQAIGIAREQGSTWRWATSYGSKQDCGAPPAPAGAVQPPAEALLAGATLGERSATASFLSVAEESGESTSSESTTGATPPTAAFTVSRVRPRVNAPVTITNRSRDASGNPIAATLEPSPGVFVTLGPDASTTRTFPSAGLVLVSLHATAGDVSSSVTRRLEVRAPSTLTLEYLGDTKGVTNRSLLVNARANDSTAGQPAEGVSLRFELLGKQLTATTGSNGRAGGSLDLSGVAPGFYTLSITFDGNDDYTAAQIFTLVQVVTNAPPVADTGGPYTLGEGQTLILDGSRSSDPDAGDFVTKWEWDVNGNGSFGDSLIDVSGQRPNDLTWGDLQLRLCGGTCLTGVDYTVGLRVTDRWGDQATVSTTVRFTSDFAVFLGSGTQVVVPGASNHFGVTVVGSSTWGHDVTLSVEGLPAGITGTFSRTTVTPPGSSVLTLTAASNAPSGTFAFVVKGTSNGVVRTAGQVLEVTFGLIPKCYGAYAGIVTDRDTGAPLEGVTVHAGLSSAVTEANGRYSLTKIELGFQNQPFTLAVDASVAGYWPASKLAEASCGTVTPVDLALRRVKTGRVAGLVVDKETRAPITGATIGSFLSSAGSTIFFNTGADGRYAGEVGLLPDNAPRQYFVSASAPGYWSQVQNLTARADEETRVDYELLRKCFGTLTGGVVRRQGSTEPIANARVVVVIDGLSTTVLTGPDGTYRFDLSVPLGSNNQPISYMVSVQPPLGAPAGSVGSFQLVRFEACGEAHGADLVITIPVENAGAVEGYVLDQETRQPLAGATVTAPNATLNGPGQSTVTDANGFYRFDKIFIGLDGVTTGGRTLFYSLTGYWPGSRSVSLTANQTTRADLELLKQRFAVAEGSVTDAETGAPIPFANISGLGGSTDRLGKYRSDLLVQPPNLPFQRTLRAEATGYWFQQKTATYAPDQTTTVDFQLLRECPTAKVIGKVVNAETQAPIQGALLLGSNGGFALTNALGRFELTDLHSGHNNVPSPMSITASASGFLAQTKSVTIFCGATITLDFGNRSSATGTIVGTLTNLDTGQPIPNAFVGGEFGQVTTTDTTGSYRFLNVPLSDLDADRPWLITATVPGFKTKTQTAIARAGQETRADFGFTVLGNARPVAVAQQGSINEDPGSTPLKFTLAGTDADGDPLTYHVMKFPEHGLLSGTLPNVEYRPFTNYSGPDSFEFVANDGQELSARATVAIDVLPVNDSPRAFDDTFERPRGAPFRIPIADILANDTDVDGDPLHIAILQPFFPAQAVIDGTDVLVTPAPTQTQVLIQYYAGDPSNALAFARITINLVTTPLAPVCTDKTFSGPAGAPLSGAVTCSDGNGDAVTYSVVDAPVGGTLALSPNGSFTYTPPAGFVGTKTFTFRASDGTLLSGIATATLTFTQVNRAPTADGQAATTDEDVALPLTLTGSDSDGDALTFEIVDGVAHGSLSGTGAARTYTPAPDYHGPDSFTFRTRDGVLDSNLATVSLTVRPVNDAPAADDRFAGVTEDTPRNVTLTGSDVDGDPLTFAIVGGPAHGTLTGTGPTRTYTPAPNFHGPDSFTYRANDGALDSNLATFSLIVTAENDAPTAEGQTAATDEDTALALTLAGADVDGDALTFAIVGAPAHGSLSGTGATRTYTPAPDYHGPDSFTFRTRDGALDSNLATVALTVRPVNDAPTAAGQSAATDEDTPLPLTLAGADVDGDALTFAIVGAPAHGSLSGTGATRTYTPAPDYHGPDSFTFRTRDGALDSNLATVALTVRPVNDAPTAAGQSAETDEDTPLPLTLAGADVDGDALTFTIVDAPAHGTLTGTGPTRTYTPAPDYHGPDSFSFRANDGSADSSLATVSLTVRSVNDVPTAVAKQLTTPHATPVGALLEGADADGDALTFAVQTPPAHGTLTGTPPALTYTPAAGFSGGDSFTYRAFDGTGVSAPATIQITVGDAPLPTNGPPTITLAPAGPVDEASALPLSASAGDPDGDSLSYTWSTTVGTITPAGSTASLKVDDGPATAVVAVTVDDGHGHRVSDAKNVTVRNVPPTATAGSAPAGLWGLGLLFAGTVSDPSAADTAAGLQPLWSFGDGSTAPGTSATHPYAAPGPYTATLSVTDKDGGTGSASTNVLVSRRPSALAYTGPTAVGPGAFTISGRLSDGVAAGPLAGRTVVFTVDGVTYPAITDGSGVAQRLLAAPPSSPAIGLAFAGDTLYLDSAASATLSTASSAGKVTAGALKTRDGGRGGMNAQSDGTTVKGELQWQKKGLDFHAHELTSLRIEADGRTAWVGGVGSDGRSFTAQLVDNGDPGKNDLFRIWIGGVLQTPGDGKLTGGNVQVHGGSAGASAGLARAQ